MSHNNQQSALQLFKDLVALVEWHNKSERAQQRNSIANKAYDTLRDYNDIALINTDVYRKLNLDIIEGNFYIVN